MTIEDKATGKDEETKKLVKSWCEGILVNDIVLAPAHQYMRLEDYKDSKCPQHKEIYANYTRLEGLDGKL